MNGFETEAFLRELASREQIHMLVLKLSRALDRNDRAGILAAYHPGALDHHGEFDGPVEDFVDWINGLNTERFESMSHIISNHYVEFEGSTALGETYVTTAIRTRKLAGQQVDIIAVGRYLDRYEKRDDYWRIAERTVVLDWQHADPVPADMGPVDILRLRGTSNVSDPSYNHFRR